MNITKLFKGGTLPMVKTDYTREELINLCPKSIDTVEKWNLDYSTTINERIGECWAMLMAGCPFRIVLESDYSKEYIAENGEMFVTNENMVAIKITLPEGEVRDYFLDL
jgi:hypothetical protein